jgi:hypothetical protein
MKLGIEAIYRRFVLKFAYLRSNHKAKPIFSFKKTDTSLEALADKKSLSEALLSPVIFPLTNVRVIGPII